MSGLDVVAGGGGGRPYTSGSYSAVGIPEKRWSSWLVPTFVVANVVVFVVTMFVNNCPKNNEKLLGDCAVRFFGRMSFQPLEENLQFGPSALSLGLMGALEWYNVVHGQQGWRLITCIWLHAGVIHLLVNSLSLVAIGIPLEKQFGFARVGSIYLLSGFEGSILSSLFTRTIISAGASSDLFGLFGAILSSSIINWTIYTIKAAPLIAFTAIIAVNLAVGALPHVDNFANIGGFMLGFLLGFVLLIRPQSGWAEHRSRPAYGVRSKHNPYQYALWSISLVLVIAGFVVGFMMLFRGVNGNEYCSWCNYLRCVSISRW